MFFVFFHDWFSLNILGFWCLTIVGFKAVPLNDIYDNVHGLTVNIDGIVSISISGFPSGAISGFEFLSIVVAMGVTSVVFLLGIYLQYY